MHLPAAPPHMTSTPNTSPSGPVVSCAVSKSIERPFEIARPMGGAIMITMPKVAEGGAEAKTVLGSLVDIIFVAYLRDQSSYPGKMDVVSGCAGGAEVKTVLGSLVDIMSVASILVGIFVERSSP
ncbi:hypothetical protein OPT61_g6779 [Boeremia exigua]|uniref:Uncharacterized protein n=1 Tax=Boeremia exigua TaxID=749465 RepID=A0ACC2I4Z6_9PLEO|nr:hypothetical protein OPT61_g6779 [Boeremia exigua]